MNRNIAANNENKPFRILKNKFFNASNSKMERERSPKIKKEMEVEDYTKSGLDGKESINNIKKEIEECDNKNENYIEETNHP